MLEKSLIHCGGVGFNFYFRGYESHRTGKEEEGMMFLEKKGGGWKGK